MKKLTDLLLITQNGMGSGDAELQIKLLGNYLNVLISDNRLPGFIAFYNEGVKVLGKDSPFQGQLNKLEQRGVKLIACSTCLNHYQIDEIVAGIKGTMPDIVTLQCDAQKVITL
ncbi:DsrE family protein [Carboxylicivirga mesophila]|uniref:DsrE family protein n=1 Tax=Carboxylicivirga mesophila TaxID=1166478 RepID=A0ABS5KB50_9BACT|nr:DsrE family protein [Carboxylicivirga mesophila]MBS2212250.1 DsrE family protein [Carboxylicivirga mesophila]